MNSISVPSSKFTNSGTIALCLSLAVLLLPTLWRMAKEVWVLDEQAHGPIILLVVIYLVWKQRDVFNNGYSGPAWIRIVGYGVMLLGALSFIIGRTQDIIFFEVGGQIACIGGLVMILLGAQGVMRLWFPIFFLVFMLPLPGFIVDQATSSLKLVVSEAAASVMHFAGLPIARDGVLLLIGQYKLLVADACSGLYSLISLSALGILYLWLIRSANKVRNALLFLAIFPIAIAANITRVIILSLITYYMGDEAGQGFLHGFAGMSLFLAALTLIIGLDSFLHLVMPDRKPKAQLAVGV